MNLRNCLLTAILILGAAMAFGQSKTISGTVIDPDDNFPLPGVTVSVKGSGTGTITDYEGKYTITAQTGDSLEFSFVGYASQTLAVNSSLTTLDISLSTESTLLDEVVIVGYGAVKKEDLTGVVTKIGQKEFNRGIITSPEKLLTGKVAGLSINSSGDPGGGSKIVLRGGTGLTDGGKQPLIVIDGVALDDKSVQGNRNPLNFVNPSDIADITVLKDASASAIYGSRGANGVIIITTKSGQAGKLKVDYTGNVSISRLISEPTVLSPANFRAAISAKAPQLLNKLGETDNVWLDEILQQAFSHQNTLSFSGGKNTTRFFASLNHRGINGILKNSKNTSSNLSLNFSTGLFDDKFKIRIKSKTGFVKDILPPNTIGAALAMDPTQPVLDADSQYGGYFEWTNLLATGNPVASIDLWDEQGSSVRTLNNLDLEYELPWVKGLSLHSNISYDLIKGKKFIAKDSLLKADFINGGYTLNQDIRNYALLWEAYGTYKKELKNIKSKIEFTAGYAWQDFDQEDYFTSGNKIVADASLDSGFRPTGDIEVDSFLIHNRLISFFGRLNYNLDEKYLLTLSLRRDGSSRFGGDNKWGLFPSAAVAWRVLQENFASGLSNTFSDLKFRFSYGVTGDQSIEDFLYATFYGISQDDARYQFGDEFINLLRGDGVDPNIKWEGTNSTNIGLDFGILNGRLTGAIDVYNKTTNDLLFDVATAAFTNLSDRIKTNIAQLENQGIELALNGVIVDRSDFDWSVGYNVSLNKNKILKIDNSNLPDFQGYETGGISGDVGQTIQIIKVGEAVGAFRTYRHKLDASGNPLPDNSDFNDDGQTNALDIYEDINNDGLINENDLVISKKSTPDVLMGLTSNVSWKNFDLGLTLRANLGNYVYNNVASSTGYFARLNEAQVTNNIDESAFRNNFRDRQLKSDVYIENASFLKLDNITLGYSLNELNFARSIRFYATAQNILTITGYSGLDPEAPQNNGGIDNNIYPISTNFIFGLNASF